MRATPMRRVCATCRVPFGLIPVTAATAVMSTARPSHASQLMTRTAYKAPHDSGCAQTHRHPSATGACWHPLEEVMAESVAPLEDNDIHKGAKEDDRAGAERSSHPGLDTNGLPNDPIAIASDMLGANVDQSQG
jgi:hypothetical protein